MKKIVVTAMLAAVTPNAYAADAHVIRDTIGCESIGTFMMVENFKSAGDDVAAKKLMSYKMQTGGCRKIKKGTRIIFYHLVDYTDGDYGSYTQVRRAGDTRVWVVDKCSLDGRDPDLARFPKYVTPEKPCEN